MKGERRVAAGGEQQIDAEGRLMPGDRDRLPKHPLARGEVSPLVEFAIVRQKYLGDDAEQRAAVDDDAAIVETPLRAAAARRRQKPGRAPGSRRSADRAGAATSSSTAS